jgi:hypothetical protein
MSISARPSGCIRRALRRFAGIPATPRNTVRKVLRNEPARYLRRRQQPYRVLGPYLQVIDQWLEADKASPKKQRHTAKRIFDRLRLEYDFTGSESTVRLQNAIFKKILHILAHRLNGYDLENPQTASSLITPLALIGMLAQTKTQTGRMPKIGRKILPLLVEAGACLQLQN